MRSSTIYHYSRWITTLIFSKSYFVMPYEWKSTSDSFMMVCSIIFSRLIEKQKIKHLVYCNGYFPSLYIIVIHCSFLLNALQKARTHIRNIESSWIYKLLQIIMSKNIFFSINEQCRIIIRAFKFIQQIKGII